MTSDVALKALLKNTPESLHRVIVLMYVADQHGSQIVHEGQIFSISTLGRELAEFLLKDKKWADVAEQARKEIGDKETIH
jgi:hypothetical protein